MDRALVVAPSELHVQQECEIGRRNLILEMFAGPRVEEEAFDIDAVAPAQNVHVVFVVVRGFGDVGSEEHVPHERGDFVLVESAEPGLEMELLLFGGVGVVEHDRQHRTVIPPPGKLVGDDRGLAEPQPTGFSIPSDQVSREQLFAQPLQLI